MIITLSVNLYYDYHNKTVFLVFCYYGTKYFKQCGTWINECGATLLYIAT